MSVIIEILAAFATLSFILLMALLGLVGCLGSPMLLFLGLGMALWGAILMFKYSFSTDPNIKVSRAGWWLLYGVISALILSWVILSPDTDTRFYRRFLFALFGLIPQVLTYLRYNRNQLHTEYREGYNTCADCSIPLVEKSKQSQPEENQKDEFYEGEFVEVFQTTDQSDILTIKLAFDEEEIPNNFSGDFFLGYRAGLLARFFVPTEFELRALETLRKLNLNTDAQQGRWTPAGR